MQEKPMFSVKKKVGIAAIVMAVAVAGLFGVTKVNAATTDTANPMTSLVQKIATKFGLNQSDVQAVFDQDHADRQAEMEKKYEEQLTQYVTDGKITDAQKQLIIAKHKEMEASHETDKQNMQNMTEEQRKAAMDQKRTDLQNWATQNNIDIQYVMPKFGRGHGGGRDKFMGTSNTRPTNSASPTAVTQ